MPASGCPYCEPCLHKFRPAQVEEVLTRSTSHLADLGDFAGVVLTPYSTIKIVSEICHIFQPGPFEQKQTALYISVATRIRSLAELIWPELAGKLELPSPAKDCGPSPKAKKETSK